MTDITARQHNFITNTHRYIEEVIEDSETIEELRSDIFHMKERVNMDYNYTIDFIDELKNEISDLKQMVAVRYTTRLRERLY
jgi:hypothetical protein